MYLVSIQATGGLRWLVAQGATTAFLPDVAALSPQLFMATWVPGPARSPALIPQRPGQKEPPGAAWPPAPHAVPASVPRSC